MSENDQDSIESYGSPDEPRSVKENRRELTRRLFAKLKARGIEHVDLDEGINGREYIEALEEIHFEDGLYDNIENFQVGEVGGTFRPKTEAEKQADREMIAQIKERIEKYK
jgi:hypothetical protein